MADLIEDERRAERNRLREALFVLPKACPESLPEGYGLKVVAHSATDSVWLLQAKIAAMEGGPTVLVGEHPPEVRVALEQDVPEAEVLAMRLPVGSSSLSEHLNSLSGDVSQRREAFLDYLIAFGADGRPNCWRHSLATPASAFRPGPFPLAALPRSLRDMVVHGSLAHGVDTAYFAVPLIGIMAGCVGASRVVEVKSGWEEPAVLWAAVIAPSGAGKSPPLRALLSPVRERDRRLHEQSMAKWRRYEADLVEWKKQGAKSGLEPPVPPPMLASTLDDATLEASIARLADNPRGLLMAVDELAAWVCRFNRYRPGSGDEQAWLSMYGAEPVKVDRKGAPGSPARTFVPRAAVSVVGTIQPGVARQHLGGQMQRQSGLLARLLLARPPVVPAKWSDATIPQPVLADYVRVVEGLLDLQLGPNGAPRVLPLTAEAREVFISYFDENGVSCHTASVTGRGDLAAALSKLRGVAVRIALCLALARAAQDGVAEIAKQVDAEDMEAGVAISRWFEESARAVYEEWDAEDAAETKYSSRLRMSPAEVETRIVELLTKGDRSRSGLRDAFNRNIESDRMLGALESLRRQGKVDYRIGAPGPNGGCPPEIWHLVASAPAGT